jgi:predicted lipoprotein with Yx(FWY)xxD motif
MNANGEQVAYNGHPLSTYSGDSEPGQTNGQGFGGVWFVVTTDLAPAGGSQNNGYGS